jgi:hypothetical protein
MKRILLLACLAACALTILGLASTAFSSSPGQYAQAATFLGATPTPTCVSGYACAITPGGTIVPGTTDTGNHCDDCVTNITLPFPFSLYGSPYASVNLSSNGNAQFVSNNIEFANTCLPVTTMGPTIFPYWDDLVTEGTTCTGGCGIYTSVSGAPPNRIFNIEWRTFYFSNPGNAYFEIRLYETTNTFDVILGTINTGGTATIGVQDGAGRFTQCICNTAPTPNSRIAFTSTGGSCATLTPTATPAQSNTPVATNTSAPTNTVSRTPTPGQTNTPGATSTPSNTSIATDTPAPTNTPGGSPTPCTLSFSDVNPSDYFYVPVMYLACHGVISGYSDGTFRPYNNTTRGQLTKIVVLAEGWTVNCPTTPTFSDVPTTHTFYCYVETAVEHSIISGYADGTFRPENNVTRGQLCKIVVLAEGWADQCPLPGHFSDVPPTDPFFCYIETAYNHTIISGYADGTFRPGNPATRGQISKIVYEAITQP